MITAEGGTIGVLTGPGGTLGMDAGFARLTGPIRTPIREPDGEDPLLPNIRFHAGHTDGIAGYAGGPACVTFDDTLKLGPDGIHTGDVWFNGRGLPRRGGGGDRPRSANPHPPEMGRGTTAA